METNKISPRERRYRERKTWHRREPAGNTHLETRVAEGMEVRGAERGSQGGQKTFRRE